MSLNWARTASTRVTPQSQPIPGRADQAQNNAGGYGWAVDCWKRLDRFLILGSEGGTYYASEQKLTKENAAAILECIAADGPRTVARIVEISDAGRAPKNDPAIFALALCAAAATKHGIPVEATRAAALAALPRVCRIGTHLFHFAEFVQQFRGWGRGLRHAVGEWYSQRDLDELALQLVKYKSRDGWSHRDLLRLSHPKPNGPKQSALFKYATAGTFESAFGAPEIVAAAESLKGMAPEQAAFTIAAHELPREVVPSELLNDPLVWEALLQAMPMTAMIRNLGKMTAVGLLKPFSDASKLVIGRLLDAEALKRARVHPIQVLAAATVYGQGHGERGKLTWSTVDGIVLALEAAFQLAFGSVEPTGKRLVLGVDVSGSMDGGEIAGVPGLSPRLGAAAMALVTASVEPEVQVLGFSHQLVPLQLKGQSLGAVVNMMRRIPFGGTDCSLPIEAARAGGWNVDGFLIYTDSETHSGLAHPAQSLQRYREKSSIEARSAVVAMTSGGFTIADPKDAGMLDVVGFDTATPSVLSGFFRGEF